MDVTGMLSGLKGKVLDAAHFDILKSAYDLLNQNLEQLKSNNAAISENRDLLQEKIERLEKDNSSLREQVKKYKQLAANTAMVSNKNLSSVETELLIMFKQKDSLIISSSVYGPLERRSKIEFTNAIEDLKKRGFISRVFHGQGISDSYELTHQGQKAILTLPNQ
ncbi:MAG: hypothetical protein AAGG38_02150 [Planctomycetota bacterium]